MNILSSSTQGNFITIVTVIYILQKFNTTLFKKKNYSHLLFYITWTIFSIGNYLISIYTTQFEIPFLFGLIFLNVISYKLYEYKRGKFFYNLLFYLYLCIVDIIVIPIFSIVSKIPFANLIKNQTITFAAGICSSLFLFATYRYVIHWFSSHDYIDVISKKENGFMFIITMGEIGIIYHIIIIDNYSIVLILLLLFFIVINFYMIYLFRYIAKKTSLEEKIILMKQQNQSTQKYYKDLELKYNRSRELLHDMKNHILSLTLCEEASFDYKDKLIQIIDQLGYSFQCSNKMLTILIGEKIKLAELKNIDVVTKVEDVDLTFMDNLDLVIVFGNLLDNALEACNAGDSIHIFMKRHLDTIMLHIANTLHEEDKLILSNDHYTSTKEGHLGIGLSNVKASLDKYDGYFTISCKNKQLVVCCLIPVP